MEEEKILKETAKRNSIRDGSAYSLMDGVGLRYITPYALSLGLSNRLIGFLAVFPTLFGNILRIIFNKSYYNHNRKKMVLSFVFIQAFFWLPLILIGFFIFSLE